MTLMAPLAAAVAAVLKPAATPSALNGKRCVTSGRTSTRPDASRLRHSGYCGGAARSAVRQQGVREEQVACTAAERARTPSQPASQQLGCQHLLPACRFQFPHHCPRLTVLQYLNDPRISTSLIEASTTGSAISS